MNLDYNLELRYYKNDVSFYVKALGNKLEIVGGCSILEEGSYSSGYFYYSIDEEKLVLSDKAYFDYEKVDKKGRLSLWPVEENTVFEECEFTGAENQWVHEEKVVLKSTSRYNILGIVENAIGEEYVIFEDIDFQMYYVYAMPIELFKQNFTVEE